MSSPGRILALDVGDRRIGLAITDALGLTAQPLFTVHRTTLRADLKSVARFLRQHSVSTVVVGNPLHMDGSPSPQAAKALAHA
jgi:putative Holliday junction resolvase